MSKTTNKSKINTFLSQQLTFSGSEVDLSSIYSSSSLSIESIELEDDDYRIYSYCNLDYGICPYCGKSSVRVHSRYSRCITDLSILGHPVILMFEARKFFCDNPLCHKKTFAEQPGNEIFRYRRRTRRCEVVVTKNGLLTSSEKSKKLLKAIGIKISGDTILRDIHRMKVPSNNDIKHIGVDDWAYRKGVTYGSIIVDLDTHNVIDILNDRNTDMFQSWLQEHPLVDTVSRDRSTDYSAAILNTKKDIIEVADRFHLCMNMSDCVKRVISSHYEDYRKLVRPIKNDICKEVDVVAKSEAIIHKKNDSRQVMFNEVKELQRKGLNINQISRKLDIARQTVRKYMSYDILPEMASKERIQYYLYDSFVENEYYHGKSLRQIHIELMKNGFQGTLTPFYDHYRYLSDGHKGFRPKSEAQKMSKRPQIEVEPLLPIRHIAHIVDKSIRDKKLSEQESGLISKLTTLGWFNIMQLLHSTIS